MLQKLYNIAGVSGFVLSLVLAILELRRRFRFLRVMDVKIVPMISKKPEAYLYMVCTVVNPASVPVPITGISIRLSGLPLLSAIPEETVIYERRNTKRNMHAEFTNTVLPVNLAPRSAQRIVALYRLPTNEPPQFLHQAQAGSSLKPLSTWLRIDLASLWGSLPRYRRAAIVDYIDEQRIFAAHSVLKS